MSVKLSVPLHSPRDAQTVTCPAAPGPSPLQEASPAAARGGEPTPNIPDTTTPIRPVTAMGSARRPIPWSSKLRDALRRVSTKWRDPNATCRATAPQWRSAAAGAPSLWATPS